jgi:type I restriction enzyme S subunit
LGGDFSLSGIPVLSAKNIKDGQIVLNDDLRYVAAEMFERWMPEKLQPGDVLLTSEAPLGEVFYVRGANYCLGQRLFALRAAPLKIDSRFLYYLLKSNAVQHRLHARATGTTAQGIRQAELVKVELDLPRLEEQRTISVILGALDDKIELNRKMNETLEAIARAIFKSWFVDFDPVRAKAEGRQPFGMDTDTAALFPDSFQDFPLGKMPDGWSPLAWGELVTLEYGKALLDYNHESGTYPVYGTNGKIGTCAEPLCKHPGIVIGRKGAYRGVHFSRNPFFVIDTAFYVEPRTRLEMRWAYYELLRQDINSMDSGSAIPSTSREDFYALPVVAPPLRVQQQFSKVLEPYWDHQARNEEQNSTLSAIRDALLPKLISGKIRIRAAEKEVEASV